MFRSLRSRLWLSNALLVLAVLLVVGIGVVLALRESPLLYRQSAARIRLAETVLVNRLNSAGDGGDERIQRLLQTEAQNRQMRFLILDQNGGVLEDYKGVSSNSQLEGFVLPEDVPEADALAVKIISDQRGRDWLYSVAQLENGNYLVTADQRPVLLLRNILSDDSLHPFLGAGLVALFLGFMLGLFISGWVASPLKRMAAEARKLADGRFQAINPEGPTEVRQLAESLNEMAGKMQAGQQSQRDFLANVTHELKTPLTSIHGFAQALLDGTVRDEVDVQQAAQVIHDETERMNRLVLDLLALAKLEAGTADLSFAPLDLGALLKHVVQKFGLQANQAQLDLRVEVPDLPVVYGDGDRLAQVFTNLVDNALKFTPSGGQIVISAQSKAGRVRISVADTGSGISEEEKARIFERFFQVDRSRRSTKGRGVGLGLPIARQIILAHDGMIWVDSIIGKGSTFYVELPCNDHRALQK